MRKKASETTPPPVTAKSIDGSDQQSYLNRGVYDNFLRNVHRLSRAYDEFMHEEVNWIDDQVAQRTKQMDEINAEYGIKEGVRVLDVGCSNGRRLTKHFGGLVGKTGEVVGIDFNEKMVGDAKKYTENDSNVKIRLLDARNLDTIAGLFDLAVLSYSFLSYLPVEDRVPVLKKIAAKLNEGHNPVIGTAFSEFAAPHQMEIYQKLFGLPVTVDEKRVIAHNANYGADRFSADQIKEMLAEGDFFHIEVGELPLESKMAHWFRASS